MGFPVSFATKKYQLLWLHWSQYGVKFRNSDIKLSTYSQLQCGKWKGRVTRVRSKGRGKKVNLWLVKMRSIGTSGVLDLQSKRNHLKACALTVKTLKNTPPLVPYCWCFENHQKAHPTFDLQSKTTVFPRFALLVSHRALANVTWRAGWSCLMNYPKKSYKSNINLFANVIPPM